MPTLPAFRSLFIAGLLIVGELLALAPTAAAQVAVSIGGPVYYARPRYRHRHRPPVVYVAPPPPPVYLLPAPPPPVCVVAPPPRPVYVVPVRPRYYAHPYRRGRW